VYTSATLKENVTVIGQVNVKLWAITDGPDTDFTAKLVDVEPGGQALNLADGIVRARYRDSTKRRSEPLEPNVPTLFRIDLWDLAHTFRPGHRIRLEISSSNFPRFDRNTNTGRELGADGEGDVVMAAQRVLHDAAHPSALVLPVATAEG
jgi:putative CocE/NonD family hydrolase